MIPVSEFAIRVNSTSQVQPVLNVQLRMERVVHYICLPPLTQRGQKTNSHGNISIIILSVEMKSRFQQWVTPTIFKKRRLDETKTYSYGLTPMFL